MKKRKKCETCGSEFELTKHHRYKKGGICELVNLCWTCHTQEDFRKNMKCYHKAKEKEYNKKMDKLEKSFK